MITESLLKPPKSRVLKSGRVILRPGECIGQHLTDKREELIVVLRGIATILETNNNIQLRATETHYIKGGVLHNVKNNHDDDLEYIYVVSLFH